MLYSDRYGLATAESQRRYRHRVRVLATGTFCISVLGLALTSREDESRKFSVRPFASHKQRSWIWDLYLLATSIAWPALSLLTLFLTQLSEPRWIFRVATSGLCLSTWILVDGFLECSLQVSTAGPYDPIKPQSLRLDPRPFWIALPLTAALLSFPRRPDVFTKDGKPIDGQLNVSLLSRYTLSWCSGLLVVSSRKQPLEFGQFPALDGSTRVQELPSLRPNSVTVNKLWQRTIRAYSWILLKQHMFMILRAILTFGPSYSVLFLLERLEQCGQACNGVWLAIAALGVSSVAENVVEYQLCWIQWSEMGIPYHAQLSMTVFEKALRRKDSKGSQWKAPEVKSTPKSVPLVTNLLTTDVAQVSNFGSVNYILPAHILKLSLSIVFVWRLLGWQSLLVGLMINMIFIPLNLRSIKKLHMAGKLLSSDRDRTMNAITEALNALRQIKISAFEKQWEEYIQRLRELETAQLRKMFFAESIMSLCGHAGPALLSVALLSTYVYVHRSITASVAFTAITLVDKMRGSLILIPTLVSNIAKTRSSADRIDQFLELPEQTNVISLNASGTVSFQNASIAWPSDSFHIKGSNNMHSVETFALRSLNLEFPSGELSIISGKTGSGKTLLLSAIIGEVDVIDGIIIAPKAVERNSELTDEKSFSDTSLIPTDVAYVSQSPWLENTSIKKNILFGLPFRKERYEKVISACALLPDLAALPAGDDTQLGVRGTSLSGGQRWRVTLARALYSKAKLLVLDDVLSALDVHVGQEIFSALNSELGQGRTRILVTHHLSMCLPKTNYVVILGDGGVKYAGSPNKASAALDSPLDTPQPTYTERELSPSGPKDGKAVGKFEKPANTAELKADVKSSLKAFRKYMDVSGGLTWWIVLISGLVSKRAIDKGQTWLLRIWTQTTAGIQNSASTTLSVNSNSGVDNLHYYMYLYLITSALFLLLEILHSRHKYVGSLKASKVLFGKMTSTILHMPLAWIDTVPIGQIIDRFTRDFRRVDTSLMPALDAFIHRILGLVILFVVGSYTSIYMGIVSLPLLIYGRHISNMYVSTQKVISRHESLSVSTLLSYHSSAVIGLTTIRAFGMASAVTNRLGELADNFSANRWYYWLFTRWRGLRFALAGSIYKITVLVLILLSSDYHLDASTMGFAINFMSALAAAINETSKGYTEFGSNLEALERVVLYTDLLIEDQSGVEVPESWPANNKIEVRNLSVAYAPELPLVLQNISFTVEASQRVGIVGRTGSGKSSLILALLRLLEIRSGTITIDGIDISTVKVHDLRSRISFMSQDPVLFSGTVRSNLNYASNNSDSILEDALRQVHLLADSGNNKFTLDSNISAGGNNLSQGQKQLLCLARILIEKPKIMVLDEAMSAVDKETDRLVQDAIKNIFTGMMLVVAHRLSTVATFDRIAVIDAGKIVEWGSPQELFNQQGHFWQLIQASTEREYLWGIFHNSNI